MTVGSQQGLDLVGRVLLGPEDRVAIENPGYLDARHIFLRTGAQVYGIDVDEHGLRPPETLRGTDLMYLTPSHHHPTNATLGIDRRHRLLQLAAESGTVIVEDDYDSEFRYHGSPSPALKALDSSGDAMYLGTFSKFLAPGLRLGYLVGPADLVRELRKARRYVLRHPPGSPTTGPGHAHRQRGVPPRAAPSPHPDETQMGAARVRPSTSISRGRRNRIRPVASACG